MNKEAHFYYFAINKDKSRVQWSKLGQKAKYFGTWARVFIYAKGLAKEFEAEIRVSNTKGYSNQGTYIDKR